MTTTMTSTSQGRGAGDSSSAAAAQPEIFRLTPLNEIEGSPVEVQTSRAPLSAREQRALDELAMLFTIQEERCLSEVPRAERESTKLSKASLTSSQMAADASFIYQHIDFQVLSKCVPGFVKSHLNRNCRYLPETFILRVNYWRRRRMIGDDSNLKRGKKEPVVRTCTELGTSGSSGGASNARSPRPQTVGGKQTTNSG